MATASSPTATAVTSRHLRCLSPPITFFPCRLPLAAEDSTHLPHQRLRCILRHFCTPAGWVVLHTKPIWMSTGLQQEYETLLLVTNTPPGHRGDARWRGIHPPASFPMAFFSWLFTCGVGVFAFGYPKSRASRLHSYWPSSTGLHHRYFRYLLLGCRPSRVSRLRSHRSSSPTLPILSAFF